jgi:4-hydroxybenzoate polyprenyltransferase
MTQNQIKPYLQLVRLPNLPTAAADSLAGALVAGASLAEASRWLPCCLASVFLYASGMVFNDLADIAIDRRERPDRPLPSGRVCPRAAAMLASTLMVLGVAASFGAGSRPGLVGLALAVMVLAYNFALKSTWLGPLAMGACRALNLALGLALASNLVGWWGLIAAISYGAFVAGITCVSRSEAAGGRTIATGLGWLIQNAAMLALMFLALLPASLHRPEPPGDRVVIPAHAPLVGPLALLIVAIVVNRMSSRALLDPTPKRLQGAVKTGILSLVWIDFGLAAAVVGSVPALAVLALWPPSFLLGRWLYST